MSEKQTHQEGDRQRTAAYLSRMLQMNPMFEGDDIIALRSRALRLKKPQQQSLDTQRSSRRSSAWQSIDAIREQCWSASPESLLQQLHALDIAGLPDLEAAANRLRVVVSHRSQLPKLTSHKDFDGDFFSCLKQVLAGSAKDTSVLRERVVASFHNGKLRKRGRRMIKLLKRELPQLYALESSWLETLMHQRVGIETGPNTTVETIAEQSSGVPFWVWWVIGFIVIRVLAAIGRGS